MLSLLRNEKLSPLWAILRIWLGYQWLNAGLHKVTEAKWMGDGTALKGFWMGAVGPESGIKYEWFKSFLEALLNGGHYTWFAKLVVLGEIAVGVGLILGAATSVALVAAAFMNLNFMLAGTASTNPVLYTFAILLLIAGPAAYKYGVDRYLAPIVFKATGINLGKVAGSRA